MKPLRTLLVLSSALIVQNYSAQQETQPSQGKVIVPKMMNGNSQTYKVNPNAPQRKTTASKFASKEEEITYLKRYKSSIETKRAYLESNPQEDAIAKNEGWYEFADRMIAETDARIEELEKQSK